MKPGPSNPATHFAPLLAQLADRGGGLAAQRADAAQSFLDGGLPSRGDEAWRYTSLEPLLDTAWLHCEAAALDGELQHSVLTDAPAARLVFVDGRWNPALSQLPVAAGIRAESLRDALEQRPDEIARWLGRAVPAAGGAAPFAALNTALLDDGAWIGIDADVQADGPIELLYLCTARASGDRPAAPAINPRNLIVLEPGAAATVVEHYGSVHDGPSFTNALTEVHLGAGAQLQHVRLQDENRAARHLSQVYLRQARASRYQGYHVSLGALWSRTEFHNRMDAEHAQFALDGLYIAGDRQLADVHLDIDHAVPHGTSRERFKGIVLGRGRAVFDGRVRVQADAQKTDAQLANDNLLLSREAEIDTKPQLEIYADDVRCSHGTTIGQLEPSQLFYLRARGIDARTARRMLCLGFAMELLEACPVDALRARVEQRLTERLDAASIDDKTR